MPSQRSVTAGPPTVQPSVRDARATSDTPLVIGLVTVCHVVPFQCRISPKMPNATPKSSATTESVESTGSPVTGHNDHVPPWKRYSVPWLSTAHADAADEADSA